MGLNIKYINFYKLHIFEIINNFVEQQLSPFQTIPHLDHSGSETILL